MNHFHACSYCEFEFEMDDYEHAKLIMSLHVLECPKHPLSAIKDAGQKLAEYAATAHMKNTLLWMEGLATRINHYLEAVNDGDRVVTHGTGLQQITAEELSTLDNFGATLE